MLDKSFDPAASESHIYRKWEASGAFEPSGEPGAEAFTIVIPPPNVTGSLHMGHALNNTLQDALIRFARMRGKWTLWQPGTDHAGIATQMVVERQLMERQEPDRRTLGREEFVNRVWAWKAESGGRITQQLRRLGASCDWSRERFTMDEGLSAAVRKVFVQLYREGLIYRDKRLVNWDPELLTAISDLEVENIEVDGHMWHFKYPLEDGETYEFPIAFDESGEPTEWETRDYISIATTRPETMLGDGAVAVHPSDKRYAPIVGKRCLLPLADRYIPIIADEYPDPNFGSGAVKITGAHDFNDYEVARRHNIPLYVLMDERARMLDDPIVPEKYRGMDRFEARKAVVADIEARGLLIKIEDKKIMQPFGDRSGVVIEPMLTDQWYVDAKALAEPAIKAVEKGETRFVPENWTKTYFQWMRNIQPWCVSRQLWWGHQIPAWYGPDGSVFVAETEEEAAEQAIAKYAAEEDYTMEEIDSMVREGKPTPLLRRDEDVLDTWFSSALWPFSTLGWPEETPALKMHYPTSVLVTAFDIIFFWVARMMMMGLHFMKDKRGRAVVPFKDVYIHALVLDEKGQKMSKSKGNVIDPLGLIDKYGADALRFTLAAQAAQGRNIRLSEARVEGYRNFGTKLWNAARFCEMNGCIFDPDFDASGAQNVLNQWIIHETNALVEEVTRAIEAYRFNDAAGALYKFIWNIFCDWYVELSKSALTGGNESLKAETQKTAAWTLDHILKLLHPFMPFITEALWGETAQRDTLLISARWPERHSALDAPEAAAEMNWVIGLISAIRSVRTEMNVPAGARIPFAVIGAGDQRLKVHEEAFLRLARLSSVTTVKEAAKGAVQIVHDGQTFALPLAGVIDIAAERARLEKEIAKAEIEIGRIDKKLSNKNFVEKAPEEVVEEQRERRAEYEAQREKIAAALERLKGL
ncbi:MAG: valine--tRNA ligase [Alphaproteobacteria bacterium]|nr:valine--tRNA ligase [Alphaproteobacteria bacterium]